MRHHRHPGYVLSQVVRKRIEEAFGWLKGAAGLRQTRHRRLPCVAWAFTFAAIAYNLISLPALRPGRCAGNLVRLVLLPAQRHDSVVAAVLIRGIKFGALLGDDALGRLASGRA